LFILVFKEHGRCNTGKVPTCAATKNEMGAPDTAIHASRTSVAYILFSSLAIYFSITLPLKNAKKMEEKVALSPQILRVHPYCSFAP
jgi:hypothetical protein